VREVIEPVSRRLDAVRGNGSGLVRELRCPLPGLTRDRRGPITTSPANLVAFSFACPPSRTALLANSPVFSVIFS